MATNQVLEAWSGPISEFALLAIQLLLQSSVLLGCCLITAHFLRHRGPLVVSLAHRATLCALVATVLVSTLASPYIPISWQLSPPNLHLLSVPATSEAAQGNPSAKPESTTDTNRNPIAHTVPRSAPQKEGVLLSPSNSTNYPAKGNSKQVTPASASIPPATIQSAPVPSNTALTAATFILGVWLLGILVGLTWLVFCHLGLVILRRRCHVLSSGPLWDLLQELCVALRVPPLLLMQSATANSPFLCGLRRPAIVLPVQAESWTDETRRAVLLHELEHVKRADLYWMLAAQLMRAMLWPQPLMWLLLRRLDNANEQACDAAVLQHGCSAHVYARCLLDLADNWTPKSQQAVTAGVAPVKSAIGQRLRLILENRTALMPVSTRVRLAVILGALTVATASALLFSFNSAPKAAADSPTGRSPRTATTSVDLSSPDATVRSFIAALNRRDAAAIAACLTGTEEDLLLAATTYAEKTLLPSKTTFAASNLQSQAKGDHATAQLDVSQQWRRRDGQVTKLEGLSTLELRREGRTWRILPRQLTRYEGHYSGNAFAGVLDALSPPQMDAIKKWAQVQGSASISGRAVRDDGTPLSDKTVSVQITPREWQRLFSSYGPPLPRVTRGMPTHIRQMLFQSTTTGQDGSYRFSGLAGATYQVQLSTYTHTTGRSAKPLPTEVVANNPVIKAQEGQNTIAPDIKMTRGALIKVQVMSAATQKALPEVSILVSDGPFFKSTSTYRDRQQADSRGLCVFRVPEGKVHIELGRSGMPRRIHEQVTSSGGQYYFTRKVKRAIDGKLRTPEGASTTQLQVAKGQTRTVTFWLRGYVAPPPAPAPRWRSTYARRVPAASAIVTGRVIYDDGRPVVGARVTALIQRQAEWAFLRGHDLAFKRFNDPGDRERWQQIKGVMSARSVTGADGRFRLTGLTTAPYNLVVGAPKVSKKSTGPSIKWVGIAVEGMWAKAGQVIHRTQPMVLRQASIIEGTIVDKATGQPLAGVQVGYNGPQLPESADSAQMARSNKEGRFRAIVASGRTGLYIMGPAINSSSLLSTHYQYADNGKRAQTYCIRTNRGAYAGSNDVEYTIDNQKPQFGLDFGKRIDIEVAKGQTRKLTLRLRRIIEVPDDDT